MSDESEKPQQLRPQLVEEAAKFLTNPKVVIHSEDKKSMFLKKKGLSEEEIMAAFSKAEAYTSADKGQSSIPPPRLYSGPMVPAYLPTPVPSVWSRVRDVCNVILILAGASYGLHYIYQSYIGPWLTGRRRKTVDESMLELQQSVVSVLKEVQNTLSSLEQTLTTQNVHIQALNTREGSQVNTKQIDQLRSEVSSLKGLLINKRTFPSTPTLVPSIPTWQRSRSANKCVEEAAESSAALSNQTQLAVEGETAWQNTNTQESNSIEDKGMVEETVQAVEVMNGKVSEDVLQQKECEESAEFSEVH